MGLHSFGGRDVIEVAQKGKDVDVLRSSDHGSSQAHEFVREAEIEVVAALDFLDVLGRKLETEGLDVRLEVLDLATSEDGEDVRRLKQLLASGILRAFSGVYPPC